MKTAARGLDITALEPSPEMAAVLRSKGINPIETTFESWPLEPAAFRLVYAAQSWHWVHGADRYERVASALAPGGVVALFWNQGGEWDGELGAANDAVYEQHAPHLTRSVREWNMDVLLKQLSATPGFAAAEKRTVTWSQSYTRAEWESLLGTHSDHRILPEEQRRRLHAAVGDVIDAHGGRVDVTYDVNIYLARRQ
jgi:SAM-dependent methyltransferase